jgi:phi13 family phage major tail protein
MAKKVLNGLDRLYYALLNYDTTAGVSYQTPVALKGAITVSYNPNSEVSTLFADDGPYDTAETIGEIELNVGIADISQEDYAAIMGHTVTGGVLYQLSTDQPVDLAFGFRAKRSNGGYSYYWFLKGKFAKPSMDHETKGSSISWQTPELNGKFVARIYDSAFLFNTRDDADDYTAAIGTAWFTTVYGTTADVTAPTFSSSDPSANITTATQTTNITIRFSEQLLSSTVTAENFTVIMASAGTTVSGALTYAGDTTSAVVTIAYSAMLTAVATYSVIIGTGVRDLSGNKMSAAQTFKFTTSA